MTREFSNVRKIASGPAFWLSAAVVAFGAWALATPSAAQEGIKIPAPVLDEAAQGNSEVAVLAGGCFWGVQGVFQHVEGVANAVSGYAGGDKQTAQYNVVGSGATGHAEAVKVTFDPRKISYGQILQIYFSVAHDPTQLNRQGPDTGTQYRSTIFPACLLYTSEDQRDGEEEYEIRNKSDHLSLTRVPTWRTGPAA